MPILVGAIFIDLKFKGAVREKRNIQAREVYFGILNGEEHNFFLYLRPFKVDKKQKDSRLYLFDVTTKPELEQKLADILIDSGLLIGLGNPYDAVVGAGRVMSTEEEWREQILKLIKEACYIFIIPSNNPGTFWEIEQIVELNLLSKTIFITPLLGKNCGYTISDWDQTNKLLQDKFGFCFPNSAEFLYVLDKEKNCQQLSSIPKLLESAGERKAFCKKLGIIGNLEDIYYG